MRVVYLKTTLKQKFPKFDKKWVQLGFGVQAVVYSDGNFAYKVCSFKTNYVKWLLNLRENKLLDNPHVPEVYKIYVDKHKKMCIVQMELLSHGDELAMAKTARKIRLETENFYVKKSKKPKMSNMDVVLKNLAEFLRKEEKKNTNVTLDFHGWNVMMRHKQYVITDPVV